MSSIRQLLETMDLIESSQQLVEDAEHVANSLAATIRGGQSIRASSIAKGINDENQQLEKAAGTLAAIWNVMVLKANDPQKRLSPDKVFGLLKAMDVRPQDVPTASLIDTFAPTGSDAKKKWVNALTTYEQAVASRDPNQLKNAQSKLLPIINKLVTEIQQFTAQNAAPQQPQGSSLDFT